MSSDAKPNPRIETLRLAGQLPSPKGVALAIMELSTREEASVEDVARLVKTDPALTGRLLRMANSVTAGCGRPIVSIPDAVARLGLATVCQVAMGFSIVDQYKSGRCEAFDYARFWSYSLLMGVAMHALGQLSRAAAPEELFACGLMARIGCLALATVYPVEYAELLRAGDVEGDFATLERQRLQVDHNELTAAILKDCGIASALVEPVYHHEAPETAGFAEGSRPYKLVHLFHHARRLADMEAASDSQRHGLVSELMLLGGKLGLDAQQVGELFDRVVVQWREWAELLAVPARALPSFADMASAPAPPAGETRAGEPEMRVLIVTGDRVQRHELESILAGVAGIVIDTAGDGREALAVALETAPRIVVTDGAMPGLGGLEFCRALRASQWGQSIYIVMLTAGEEEAELGAAFEAGVDDYLVKPASANRLRARMRAASHYVKLLESWERDREQLKQFAAELATSNRKLEHYALTDLLTGLPNRRAAMNLLGQAWSASNRSGRPMAVMVVDIDRFKKVNDTHGHAVGDKVLTEVGQLIRATARKDDQVCRTGGEEFLVICQNTDVRSALQAAERLRRQVSETSVNVGVRELTTSISIGLACTEPDTRDAEALVVAADRALYAAKEAGRNRVFLNSGGQLLGGRG